MNPVIILTPNDFERLVVELKEHLSKEIQSIKDRSIEKPICRKEAAAYLGIHVDTLDRRIENSKIPASVVHQIDGQRVFFKSELYDFVKKS
jgi:hypothetical protein